MVKGIGKRETTGFFQSLQYADDALIFSSATRRNIISLTFILYSYELLTGLKIKFGKSTVTGIGILNKHRDQIAAILESKSSDFPLSYLALLLWTGKLTQNDWKPLVEKITKKLA